MAETELGPSSVHFLAHYIIRIQPDQSSSHPGLSHPSPRKTEPEVATDCTQARILISQVTFYDSWYKNGKPLAARSVLGSLLLDSGCQAPVMAQDRQEDLHRGPDDHTEFWPRMPEIPPMGTTLSPSLHIQAHCAFQAGILDKRWDFSYLAIQMPETDAKTINCPQTSILYL